MNKRHFDQSAAVGREFRPPSLGEATAKFSAASPPRQTSDVDTVHEVLSFANTLASRIMALSDATCGGYPQKGSDGVEVAQDGVMPRLVTSATYTRGRLGDAMEALGRIERSLGVAG